MPASTPLPTPRYRRRILAVGLIGAGALFSFVAPIYVNRIEDDLEQRVPEELAESGFAGITSEFSGQDGTLWCVDPLTDPEAARAAAHDVWGVRAITLDRSCRVNRAPDIGGDDDATSAVALADTSTAIAGAVGPGTAAPSTVDFATVADLIAADRRLSYLSMLLEEAGLAAALDDPTADPVTIFAPTDAAFERLPADANAQLRSDTDLLSELLRGHVAVGNHLASDLGPGPITMIDDRTIEIGGGATSVTLDGASVVERDLVAGNGVVHVIDRVLIPDGVDLSEPEPPLATAVATSVAPTTVAVTTQPAPATSAPATGTDAAALAAELDAVIVATPVRFAAGRAVLTADSAPALDQLAARLREAQGVTIVVEGHTDSDGDPARNLALSQQRADAVRVALIERGVTSVPITAEGFGSQRPVLVNGVEDAAASRRVEFRIEGGA